MLKVVDVEIDSRAVIPCPKLPQFQLRYAAKGCNGCEFFKGVAQMSDEGEWHDRYAIRCAAIIERRTKIIEIVDSE